MVSIPLKNSIKKNLIYYVNYFAFLLKRIYYAREHIDTIKLIKIFSVKKKPKKNQ